MCSKTLELFSAYGYSIAMRVWVGSMHLIESAQLHQICSKEATNLDYT